MALIAKEEKKEYTPAPEGVVQAVCCDVIDLGIMDGMFGPKHAVEFRWQIDAAMDTGKPYLVAKRLTLSLHEKSGLRKDLEAWLGRKMTEAERAGFDLEQMVEENCQLLIVHKHTEDGRTFANVGAIMPLGKGQQRLAVREYTRQKDRTE